MKVFILMAIVLLLAGAVVYFNDKFDLEDDNIFEEIAEEILEKKTGLDVDFSPSSEESSLRFSVNIHRRPNIIVSL